MTAVFLIFGSMTISSAQADLMYTYDAKGQLIGVDYGDGTTIQYTYDAAGNLLTRQVTVDQTHLYFPFYQAPAGTFLGIAVSNYSNSEVPLVFTAYDAAGQLASYGQNPSAENLASGRQSARLATEIFKAGSAAQNAWVELSSNSAELGSFFQFGNSSLTQLDGSIALSRHNREFHFSRIYQGEQAFRGQRAVTYLSIANPTDQAATLELRLFTSASSVTGQVTHRQQAGATAERTIPAKGFVYEDIAQLFEINNVTEGYVSARLTGGSGVVAFELIELPDRTTVIGLNASDGNLSTSLYSAQLADASVIYTSLKLISADFPRSGPVSRN
jgi:YD repeat-containing protein